jgi:hypothetical protein
MHWTQSTQIGFLPLQLVEFGVGVGVVAGVRVGDGKGIPVVEGMEVEKVK